MHILPPGCGYSVDCKTSWISYCIFTHIHSIFTQTCVCVCVQILTIDFDTFLSPQKAFSFISHDLLLEKHLFTFIHIVKKSSKSITAYPFALVGMLCSVEILFSFLPSRWPLSSKGIICQTIYKSHHVLYHFDVLGHGCLGFPSLIISEELDHT